MNYFSNFARQNNKTTMKFFTKSSNITPNTGVVKELRKRQQFDKPSVIHRANMMKAIYVQKLREAEANQ